MMRRTVAGWMMCIMVFSFGCDMKNCETTLSDDEQGVVLPLFLR